MSSKLKFVASVAAALVVSIVTMAQESTVHTPFASAGLSRSRVAECETDLKEQILNGEVKFVKSGHEEIDGYLDGANKLVSADAGASQEQRVTLNRSHRVVRQSATRYRVLNSSQFEEYSAAMELSTETPKWPINIELSATNVVGDQTIITTQFINYSDSCEAKAAEANVAVIKATANNLTVDTYAQVSEKPHVIHQSRQVTLPDATQFLPALLSAYGTAEAQNFYRELRNKKLVVYGSYDVPYLQMKVADAEPDLRLNRLTGEKENLNGLKLRWTDDKDATVNENEIYSSSSSQYSEVVELTGFTDAVVDKAYWLKKKITDGSETISKVAFDEKHFEGRKKLNATLKTNLEMNYPNLGAYWQVNSTEAINEPKSAFHFSYNLTARRRAISKVSLPLEDRSTKHPEFLKATYFVESEIHDIESLIEHLREGFHGSRFEFAQKIAELVNVLIVFDDEMVDNNTIAPLKTSEILKRGKGVCQHYAILFAALARAAGIPTRIVSGYALDANQLYDHAWNEIELTDNVWLPVEPQYKRLSQTQYWTYMPLTVSAELDDPTRKEDLIREHWLMTNFAFSLEEVPKE